MPINKVVNHLRHRIDIIEFQLEISGICGRKALRSGSFNRDIPLLIIYLGQDHR